MSKLEATDSGAPPLSEEVERPRSVTFRLPLSAFEESLAQADQRRNDTDLGQWWRGQRRYTLNYDPFADGGPGFVLIDRNWDLIIWARQGPERCMRFGSWQTAVSAALAREEWYDDE